MLNLFSTDEKPMLFLCHSMDYMLSDVSEQFDVAVFPMLWQNGTSVRCDGAAPCLWTQLSGSRGTVSISNMHCLSVYVSHSLCRPVFRSNWVHVQGLCIVLVLLTLLVGLKQFVVFSRWDFLCCHTLRLVNCHINVLEILSHCVDEKFYIVGESVRSQRLCRNVKNCKLRAFVSTYGWQIIFFFFVYHK